MPDFNVQAIVLKRSHYGETDNILTLFTKERGKISAIAKGARKPISRLSGATEVLSQSRLSLATGRTLQIIKQAEVIDTLPAMREEVTRLACGLYAAELVSSVVTDNEPNGELYDLFASALGLISWCANSNRAARWFEIQLLDLIGYAPLLTECVYCRANLNPVANGSVALSASQGGVLCYRHEHSGTLEDHSILDTKSLQLMQYLSVTSSSTDPNLLSLLSTFDDSDSLAGAALRRYIRFTLDRDLKSLAFLDAVQKTS